MERNVEGEEWKARGWLRVIKFLYDHDVTSEHSVVRVPEEISEDGFDAIESLHPRSDLLSETGLSEDQAIMELNYLKNEDLVDFFQPFQDTDFGVYRLTDQGFRVAHDLQRTEKEEDWRSQNTLINVMLTFATGILAATALVQGLEAYWNNEPPLSDLIAISYTIAVLIALIFIIGRRGSRGPDFWG